MFKRGEQAYPVSKETPNNVQPTGPELLTAVRVGFIRKGTTFSAWCRIHGINRPNATMAILGGWRGPKGQALVKKIIKAAKIDSSTTLGTAEVEQRRKRLPREAA